MCSASKGPQSDTIFSLLVYEPESKSLTYGKMHLHKESPKEPDASNIDLLSTFVNFLVDIQKTTPRDVTPSQLSW
jgi:hypothetical protein